jgi:hypothetical protein
VAKTLSTSTLPERLAILACGALLAACTSNGSFSQHGKAQSAGAGGASVATAASTGSSTAGSPPQGSADAQATPPPAAAGDDELEDLETEPVEPLLDEVDPNEPAPEDLFKQESTPPPDEAPAEEEQKETPPPSDDQAKDDTPKDSPPPVTDFKKFCTSAAETKLLSRAGLKALHGELCEGATPKALLTTTLIANAYAGSGTIPFTTLRALASDGRAEITSMRFAYAIKMPTGAKDYFDRVLPKTLEPEGLKAVVEGPGGTAAVKLLESYTKDGPHHVRGVLANQVLQKQVQGRDVTVESDTRTDQFLIEDGATYMVTTTVMRAVSSIYSQDTLSALVKVGDQSYFITVVDAAVRNRGFSRIAERELARSSIAGATAMYQRVVKNSMP